jgi:hypothetical protein
MENSFRDRVDKIFGSLTPSSSSKPEPSSSKPQPSSSLQSGLWSLTDDAIERKEWKRDASSLSASFDRDEIPCAASFDKLKKGRKKKNFELDDDMDELDDDEDDGELNRSEDGLEDWEIRSSIGLDPTLDNEVEIFPSVCHVFVINFLDLLFLDIRATEFACFIFFPLTN